MRISKQLCEIARDIRLSDVLAVSQTIAKSDHEKAVIFDISSSFAFNFLRGISLWSSAFIPAETQDLEGGEPSLAIKATKALLVLRQVFSPVRQGFLPFVQHFFSVTSHRARPVLQEFRFVLRAGVHPSTSVLQARRWGCGWLPIM